MMGGPSPAVTLASKSTQDLLDRLAWLECRHAIAEARVGHWMNERVLREEQMADVVRVLRDRGIVQHRPVVVTP
jgi:hypothetical protein